MWAVEKGAKHGRENIHAEENPRDYSEEIVRDRSEHSLFHLNSIFLIYHFHWTSSYSSRTFIEHHIFLISYFYWTPFSRFSHLIITFLSSPRRPVSGCQGSGQAHLSAAKGQYSFSAQNHGLQAMRNKAKKRNWNEKWPFFLRCCFTMFLITFQ